MKEKVSPPLVVLGDGFSEGKYPAPLLFSDLVEALTFNDRDDITVFFNRIEDFLKQGYWLCGYFAYEFGYYLEPALYSLIEKTASPLVWLGVCRRPKDLAPGSFFPREGNDPIGNIKAGILFPEYAGRIEQIKRLLEEGVTYQVNFTFKNEFEFRGDAYALFARLQRRQPTAYAAFIDTGHEHILSLSPELFFRKDGRRIVTRPMKGTVRRGHTPTEDREKKEWLSSSDKIKAENIMITDMLRNDLGRIARAVTAPHLFTVESYKTLYQMTSTVEAELRENIKIKDIFFSLFPSASVTGAPKIRTMQIIKKLEKAPRGIYTGAIGYISPQGQACFNVAIRTVHLRGAKGEMGIGGGIVHDSFARSEYAEALLKAKFLVDEPITFSLIESILWTRAGGFFLLAAHCRRLQQSCAYFSIPLDLEKLERELKNLEEKFLLYSGADARFKVRVLLDEEGRRHIDKELIEEAFFPLRARVSSKKIDPHNIFLYHKTTHRHVYDEELAKAKAENFFDVIFLNTRGELTEGAVSNIFLEKAGALYTPPVECGLLAGVLRDQLISESKVREKKLFLEDIYTADKVYIGNSVRGLRQVSIVLP